MSFPSSVRIALLVAFLGACGGGDTTGSDASTDAFRHDGPLAAFAAPCHVDDDCVSGLCVRVSATAGVCTRTCTVRTDCPVGSNWGCVAPEGLGANVCGCVADSATEICGDGRDNDCNGATDDCRTCGGVPVPMDDPRNCGTCGHACRADESCHAGACTCTTAGLTECLTACVDTMTSQTNCGRCNNACSGGHVCMGGTCTCPPTAPSVCSGVCVNTVSDAANCGTCGNVCGSGTACVASSCACTDTTRTLCAGVGCIDTMNNAGHCGSCTHACAPGESCSAGACSCASGVYCAGTCIPAGDPANCGACGHACGPTQTCTSGSCTCPGFGQTACGSICTYTDSDPGNCGTCGHVCRADQFCSSGACACPFGTMDCSGACVDTRSAHDDCGTCGHVCSAAQVCSSSTCTCPFATQTYCMASDTCVVTSTDHDNCGTCGHVCGATQTCSGSVCRCAAATPTYCMTTDTCVNTLTDASNCGSCGRVCSAVQTCSSGSCVCPVAGQSYCMATDTCVALATDPNNCGTCGHVCPAGITTCTGSTCRCTGAGLTLCGAACVDMTSDATNCGSCGHTCGGAESCIASACGCPAPTPGSAIRVTTTAGRSAPVAAVWTGTSMSVLYLDDTAFAGRGSLYLTHVASDGSRLDTTDTLLVDGSTRPVGSVDAVWTGTELGVVYAQADASLVQRMWLQRFDAAGVALAPVVNVSAATSGEGSRARSMVHLTWTASSGYAALFRAPASSGATTRPWFQILHADGSAPDLPVEIPVEINPGNATTEALATSGSAFAFLTFGYVSPSITAVLQFVRLNGDGSRTDPIVQPTPVTSLITGLADRSYALAWDGTQWVGAWQNQTGGTAYTDVIVLGRGPTLGTTFNVDSVSVPSAPYGPFQRLALVIDGASVAVMYARATSASSGQRADFRRYDLTYTPLGATTTVVPTFSLERAYYPVVQRTTTNRLTMAWVDNRFGQDEVFAAALDRTACP